MASVQRSIASRILVALADEDPKQHAVLRQFHGVHPRCGARCHGRKNVPGGQRFLEGLRTRPIHQHVSALEGDHALAKSGLDLPEQAFDSALLIDDFDYHRELLREGPGTLLEKRTVRPQTEEAFEDGCTLEPVMTRRPDNPFVQRRVAVPDGVRQVEAAEHLLGGGLHGGTLM